MSLTNTYVVLSLLLALMGGASFAVWCSADQASSSFGLNAFTEVLGIATTVLIVDQLLRRRDAARLLPHRAAAYQDVRFLTTHVVNLWREAFERSVTGNYPASAVDLFTAEHLERLSDSLDLDSHPNVTPKRTWWEWIPSEMARHKELAEKILERHSQVLAPTAYRAVHRIATAFPGGDMLRTIKQHDAMEKIPRPRVLGAQWVWNADYLEAIRTLITWCSKEVEEIRRAGDEHPSKVDTRGPLLRDATPPPCQMLPETLEDQVRQFREWQSTRSKSEEG